MFRDKSVLAVIPARGGSKGVPRKNVKQLAGKPLLAWTVEQAMRSQYVDRLVLSSDDTEIITLASQQGCEVPFVRPAEFSADDSSGMDVLLHALRQLPSFDYLVELQPTSPLRTTADIDACIELCIASGSDMCISVTPAEKSPVWTFWLDNQRLKPIVTEEEVFARRQDLSQAFVLNGAVFVARCDYLLSSDRFDLRLARPYVMPRERSIDIDTVADFRVAELLMKLNTDQLTGKYCNE